MKQNKILIKTDEHFLMVIKSDISFEAAYRITKHFLGVKHIGFTNNDKVGKDNLVKSAELYLKRHGHLQRQDRPIFLEQTKTEFSINDLYTG
jgi:hypothetical protein